MSLCGFNTMSCVISRWLLDLVSIVFMTTESNQGQCPFTLNDAFFLTVHRGEEVPWLCVGEAVAYGTKRPHAREGLFNALSLLPMGREKNLKGMGEVTVHAAKSLHTKEDNIMPVVKGWIPWPVYMVVWYIWDKLPYVRFYDFGNYIVSTHRL